MINLKNRLLILVVLLLTSGCYGELKGKVVDAETGKPIEGAVAMAEWTKTKGLGLTYTETVKVVETVSDKDGNILLEGCWCPFANEPLLTIYKKGYVAWNNVFLFPTRKLREGFDWKNEQVFKMDRFQKEYSYIEHNTFIYSVSALGSSDEQLFSDAYNEGEQDKLIYERNLRDKKREE